MNTQIKTQRWNISCPDPLWQKALADELDVHPVVAQLLVNRDIRDVEMARHYLYGGLSDVIDPFTFMNMQRAVDRINLAQANRDKVLVFGDYDVDGVTSSALLTKVLKSLNIEVVNHIPHRMVEGYGLNHEIAQIALQQGVSLFIAVDCGTTSKDEVAEIKSKGIDVIIIDHHQPSDDTLPQDCILINPKQKGCPSAFKDYASVGLVAKLVHALEGKFNANYLDLVALGTVADIVPLVGENRIFVKYGLPEITETTNTGLHALCQIAKIGQKKVSPHTIGFILGPRINATGRMSSAEHSLNLFLTECKDEAKEFAKILDKNNLARQKMQKTVIQEAIEIAEDQMQSDERINVLVLHKEGWHKGVLGIVASRVREKYDRPSIIISLEEGVGTASARSVDGFCIHSALSECADHLDAFGGHAGAAGLTIKEENIDVFKDSINRVAQELNSEGVGESSLNIDCEIPLNAIDLNLIRTVDIMEPFGHHNPAPIFCTRKVRLKGTPRLMGKDTIKFWVTDGGVSISAVGFGMGKYIDLVQESQTLDLAYQLSIDDWNKPPSPQMILKDIKSGSY